MDIKGYIEIKEDIINKVLAKVLEKEKAPVGVSLAIRGSDSRIFIKKGISLPVMLPFEIAVMDEKIVISLKAKYTYRAILSILSKILKEKMDYIRYYDIIYISFPKPKEMNVDGIMVTLADRLIRINANITVKDEWIDKITGKEEEEEEETEEEKDNIYQQDNPS